MIIFIDSKGDNDVRTVRFSLSSKKKSLPNLMKEQLRSLSSNIGMDIRSVHMTSRRPCWRSKQRNGGHVGEVKYSFGDKTLFLCKSMLLFHYATGHMSEHTLVNLSFAENLISRFFGQRRKTLI